MMNKSYIFLLETSHVYIQTKIYKYKSLLIQVILIWLIRLHLILKKKKITSQTNRRNNM